MASEHGMIHTISSNCLSARLPELAGHRRYQYQLSRLPSVAGDGHTGRQYGGYWRSPCSPGPCSIGGVVVVGGGGAGSASAADLLIGYCRSLPSSSGGSVHSPRDRCAAHARKQLPPTETRRQAWTAGLVSTTMRSTNAAACRTTAVSQARKPSSLSLKIVRSQRGVRSIAARTSR